MDKESVERLRFDRRLARRRGWLEAGQYESHVTALEDVTEKMTTIAEEEEAAAEAEAAEAEAVASNPEAEASPSASPSQAPIAGDFSTPGTFAASTGPGATPSTPAPPQPAPASSPSPSPSPAPTPSPTPSPAPAPEAPPAPIAGTFGRTERGGGSDNSGGSGENY